MELDCTGRTTQSLRVGGSEVEFVAPLRMSEDGKLLAVALSGMAYASIEPGILLIDITKSLRPLARFTGHHELANGFAFLGNEHILGCWADGAMLAWHAALVVAFLALSAALPHGS